MRTPEEIIRSEFKMWCDVEPHPDNNNAHFDGVLDALGDVARAFGCKDLLREISAKIDSLNDGR